MSTELTTDFDGAWKGALEQLFPSFVELFWPQAYEAIDWTQPHPFLEQELLQITRDAATGKRRVDKLVQVSRKDGSDAWVLVHIEVQNEAETDFAERMYVYNYRIYDRFRRRVASLAVLTDQSADWRPDRFGYELWGSQIDFRYPVVKLHDYRARWHELEASTNPFATVVMAHLLTQVTQQDPLAQYAAKLALIKQFYRLGFAREHVTPLVRFIDWLMQLPEELEQQLWQEVQAMEEEKKVPYLSYLERMGMEKGLQEGRQEGRQEGIEEGERQGLLTAIALGLELKFGAEGARFYPNVEPLTGNERLRQICASLKTAATLAEVASVAGVEAVSQSGPP